MTPAVRTKLKTRLIVGCLSALAGFTAVYVTLGGGDNPRDRLAFLPAIAPAEAQTSELPKGPGRNPLSTGEMANFVFKPAPEALAPINFTDGDGKPRTLADWKGRVVLLNLWATWCVPCRKELPALDKLQGELGSDKFEVVALALDRTGVDGAKKFLTERIKTEKLAIYADPTARMGTALKAIGMPTTLLLDREGREIGRLTGHAEWDTEDAKRLIKAALAAK